MTLDTSRIATAGVFAFVLLGSAFASTASADCVSKGVPNAALALPQSWTEQAGHEPSLSLVANDNRADNSIVGFWRVKLVSEGTPGTDDGTVVDDGFAQWYSDGTEVTFSRFAPATGNSCYGVWQRVGPSSYTLNHFGMSFDAATGAFLGLAQVREHVVLDRRGNRFGGTFSVDQYDVEGALVWRVVGRVIATRITVHTTIPQLL
jgi:hypothetical protein